MQITLTKQSPEGTSTMCVETDSKNWPYIANGQNINIFHGIGELRLRGYNVAAIVRYPVVCEIQ